jgi:hypothetical protein
MTNWSKPTNTSTSWQSADTIDTQWSKPTNTSTSWSKTSISNTQFNKRDISEYKAVMDDTVYTMDSSVINLDDAKLQSITAPSTNWT